MSFITSNGNVISFADMEDVSTRDQILFDSHETLDDSAVIEPLLQRATDRILSKIRSTDWWRAYFIARSSANIRTIADVPPLNANYIKDRQSDFTELCVYVGFADYILPLVANFGQEDDSERVKMEYYKEKAAELFDELIKAGDWYDFNGSGVVESNEKEPGFNSLRLRR